MARVPLRSKVVEAPVVESEKDDEVETETGGEPEETPAARKPMGRAATEETRRDAKTERTNAATGVGPSVFPTADEGDIVTAVDGERLYAPKQYTAFRVGPFTVQTRVRAGETTMDALRRASASAVKMGDEEFAVKLPKYLSELKKAEGAGR